MYKWRLNASRPQPTLATGIQRSNREFAGDGVSVSFEIRIDCFPEKRYFLDQENAQNQEGLAANECSRTSFFKKVAVRLGPFKPERVLIWCVYQDPVGFNMTVARRAPRSDEWMVSIVRWKRGTLSQKPDNLLKF